MRIVSLSLRNYRVFAELDLELPAGLVGIYGPNGSGKSSLLESIMWALYGKARTDKHGIRTSGSTGECVAEIVFEHDGRPYTVRRSLHGAGATVKARVSAGGQVVADGVTDCERYLRALVGMDASAFRSSVFSEQKQLDAFVGRAPEERRKLVLQLLGITPLEKARDAAKADANARAAEHRRLVAVIPDVTRAEERLAAAASAREGAAVAETEAQAASVASSERSAALQAVFDATEQRRRRHDEIRADGKRVRTELDRAQEAVERLAVELSGLAEREARRAVLAPVASRLDELHAASEAWSRLEQAVRALASTPTAPASISDADLLLLAHDADAADAAAREADDGRGLAHAAVRSASELLATASAALARMDVTSDVEECPTCGQPLGADVEAARRHRHAEVERLTALLADSRTEAATADATATEAHSRAHDARARVRAAEDGRRAAIAVGGAAASARSNVSRAFRDVATALDDPDPLTGTALDDVLDQPDTAIPAVEARRSAAVSARLAADAAARELAGHDGALARRSMAQTELTEAQHVVDAASARRQQLLADLQALAFDPDEHAQAADEATAARRSADAARDALSTATATRVGAERDLANVGELLAEASRQMRSVEDLAVEAQVLARTADLLTGFRHAMVATVGPRLALQASELFVELTGGEYDGLVVDPDRYELRIVDRGEEHPIARFSGSEVDLANLALRVAISEQVRFQAGGHVGLLVLDEALASLDADRKDRMLLALTRLSGRFRQVLVVTHAPEVKEQLPAAIEIVRRPGRRATAVVVDQAG